MKKLICILLIGTSFVLTGCHEHTWTDASCTQPMTCQECGETEGEMLEHTWLDATCTTPKTCENCNVTEGEVIEHIWNEATCTKPKTCKVCSEERGETVDHNWVGATCAYPKKCTVCNKTEGEAKPHDFSPATFETPKTCKNCGHTEGDVLERLSKNCDKILAYGEDKDGNYFELVANEREDFSGVTIELGIIKNNEWSVNLTTNSPFIGENGLLTKANHSCTGSIYDEKSLEFYYIGAGCFHYDGNIWNGNNGKYYLNNENGEYVPRISYNYAPDTIRSSIERRIVVNNDGQFLLARVGSYKILYANDMTVKNIGIDIFSSDEFPISEGLFAVYKSGSYGVGFFDTNGNKVIDLSCYNFKSIEKSSSAQVYRTQELVFKNGKCTFTILNDVGTEYKITIYKQGKVLSSSKVE